jgi:hypothetical protein
MKQPFLLIILFIFSAGSAQVTILNGRHVMELSGGVSTYYNLRSLRMAKPITLKTASNSVMHRLKSRAG